MFKHFLVVCVLLSIIISSYYFIKFFLFKVYKLHIHREKLKYPLSGSDQEFLQTYSKDSTLKNVTHECIFYQDYIWSTKNNNYIYDTLLDKYYIIDRGYFYYFPGTKRYQLHISQNKKIKLFNSMNKVVFL